MEGFRSSAIATNLCGVVWLVVCCMSSHLCRMCDSPQLVDVLCRLMCWQHRVESLVTLCVSPSFFFPGDKYEVLMVEDPEPQDGPGPNPPPPPKAADKSSNGSTPQTFTPEPRVAFQVVPAEMVQPPQSNGWQVVVAGILLLLLFASTVQLSLVANITKLPKETLEYFANPDNLNNDVLPPGLDTWDPAPYLASALPLFISILGINLLHEVGHRIAAAIRCAAGGG